MPPPALQSSTPTSIRDTPSLIALAVCLPLVAVSLLVLRSVVIYRRRRSAQSHGALSVGVTVDVSKVVDSPLKFSRSKTARSKKTASQTYHLDLSEFGILERSQPRLFHDFPRSSSSPPVQHSHRLPQRPLYDVRSSRLSATPMSKSTPSLSLATAFPFMDVDALAQSTIKFPRLPSLHDVKCAVAEYPTIPSLRTVSSHRVSTSDILPESRSRFQPNRTCSESSGSSLEPLRDRSLDTLVDTEIWPQAGSTLDLEDTLLSPKVDRPLSCSASVHSHFEAFDDVRPQARQSSMAYSAHTCPTAARNGSLFSPLVATSLSPLRSSSSSPESPELSLSPKLDQFLKTRSLLIDEALPDAEYLVASPASFRPLSILAPKTGYSRFSGKVLQPLFETVDIGLRDRTDHCSVSSLKSAFSLSAVPRKVSHSPVLDSPSHQATSSSLSVIFDSLLENTCDISSLRTISESPTHPSSPSTSLSPRTTHSLTSSLDQPLDSYSSLGHLTLLSPAISFKLSFSPSSPVPSSRSFDASPYARPRAPTPGSIASRFSTTLDRSIDITDMDFEVVDDCIFKMQRAPVSPFRFEVPSRDIASETTFLDVAASAPKLLPPFDFQDISPLSH